MAAVANDGNENVDVLLLLHNNIVENIDFSDDDDDENNIVIQPQVLDVEEDFPPAGQGLLGLLNILERNERGKIPLFVENVVPTYSDEGFIGHFRLSRGVARELSERFQTSEAFISLQGHGGWEPVSPQKHVLTFLWFVGHQSASYRDVADRFGLSLSALHEVITRMIDFIVSMAPAVIKDPSNAEKERTKAYYMNRKGFPGIIGCIDGTHIRIDKPEEDKDAYINRKYYFSIHVQALVNQEGKFLDVVVGWPGSVHDARVFNNSPTARDLPRLCEGNGYILGDSAYPCLPQLITPYRDNGHLTRAQRNFNRIHSSCRVTVEHAIGRLKQRFRQLYFLKLRDLERMVRLIHACCVLHNLADVDNLQHFEPPDVDDFPDPAAQVAVRNLNEMRGNDDDPVDVIPGRDLRDELCRQLAQRA